MTRERQCTEAGDFGIVSSASYTKMEVSVMSERYKVCHGGNSVALRDKITLLNFRIDVPVDRGVFETDSLRAFVLNDDS